MKEFDEFSELSIGKYLKKVAQSDNKKPFNCPYLAVLKEPVKNGVVHNRLDPTTEETTVWTEYPKGALLCWPSFGYADGWCQIIISAPVSSKEGHFDGHCPWNNNKFILSVVEFKRKKQL